MDRLRRYFASLNWRLLGGLILTVILWLSVGFLSGWSWWGVLFLFAVAGGYALLFRYG